MLDHIRAHYTQRLTLATLAKTLGRQSAYLGRLFRDEVGVTVHEYVTRSRMTNGAAQVRAGVKIEAVALLLGYRSKKNFYRQFKRRFGLTPQAYRSQPRLADIAAPDPPVAPPCTQSIQTLGAPPATVERRDRTFTMFRDQRTARAVPLSVLAEHLIVRQHMSPRIAMLVATEAGRYIGANDTAVSMTGYSVAELRRMPVNSLFVTAQMPDTRCLFQILLSGSMSLPANAVVRTKSGRSINVHLTNAEGLLSSRGGVSMPTPQGP
jgi:PAS domain S-box-containing protein